MNQKQALHQALLVVGFPTLVLGSLLLYWFRPVGGEEWLVFLAVFLIPFVLLVPLLHRKYRRGPQPVSPKRQVLAGILSIIAGAAYVVDVALSHGDKGRVLLRLGTALMWLAFGATLLHGARRAQTANAKSESQGTD